MLPGMECSDSDDDSQEEHDCEQDARTYHLVWGRAEQAWLRVQVRGQRQRRGYSAPRNWSRMDWGKRVEFLTNREFQRFYR